MAGKLKTGWIRVATEGDTIDGRAISGQDLQDMAESYNRQEYGARIWPEHIRWYACGDVLAVKAEEVDGRMRLFAILAPNMAMIELNQQDQKVYTSIEIQDNFANSGKPYLVGIAITDSPASLGTDRIKLFSVNGNGRIHAQPELFVMEELHEEEGVIRRLFGFGKQSATPPKEEEAMNKEQFGALSSSLTALAAGQTALTGLLEKFTNKPDEVPPVTPPEQPPATPTDHGVTAEQFGKLIESVNTLAQGQQNLTSKFSKLLEENPDQRPDVSGGADFDASALS
ncbi:capsid protein [Photobacterium phosphoreum]|uniref:Capsid protein n=1 Tax=Photobacterium phosphoreum TaxID=659 RepID=A0AAW4ZU87_PHOPO|nr:GPO family capsid scaffolding protein [Photobacterium phosphoreum]MCD9491074.1 capsid protein [Photobacterium phosphoreum]MCF2190316.1 capsid protein [Photobacterium phosphoreum]MCF2300903.1 capsid protein [Photobacterium phosphoreum]